ncbi:hypothetical protein FRC06_010768 [Ceratobasidium sp. 370]|nr:hypothetical protein FRC06_010768 [Ceratobasidium sp. 370]
MRRDERHQEVPSIGTYTWPNQPTYSLSDDNLSASYPESSNSPGTYGFNYSHESHGYSTPGHSPDPSGPVGSAPMGSTWVDIPLDPNAIYHMPYHNSAWPGSASSESPYEYDRLVLRQAWEQRVRDQWFRRNRINASPSDSQYDRFIPELRAGEYAERYLGRLDAQSARTGGAEPIRMAYPSDTAEPATSMTTTADYTRLPTSAQYYRAPNIDDQIPQTVAPSMSPTAIQDNISIPPPASTLTPNTFTLHPPYRDSAITYSPTETDSSTSRHPSTQPLKLSASPVAVLSALDSDVADSPLSDSYQVRYTSPARSPSTSEPVAAEPPSSSTNEANVTAESPTGPRAKSVDSVSHGHPAMGPIRRGTSAGDRGKNAAGSIRVQRPAGIKWNQRTRCAYINPATGLQCRTSAGRGPDLERHLRTVHLREEVDITGSMR